MAEKIVWVAWLFTKCNADGVTYGSDPTGRVNSTIATVLKLIPQLCCGSYIGLAEKV
jgi:hypothetical protein